MKTLIKAITALCILGTVGSVELGKISMTEGCHYIALALVYCLATLYVLEHIEKAIKKHRRNRLRDYYSNKYGKGGESIGHRF